MQNLAKQLLTLKVRMGELEHKYKQELEQDNEPLAPLSLFDAHQIFKTRAGMLWAAKALLTPEQFAIFLAQSQTTAGELKDLFKDIEVWLNPNPDQSSHAE